MAAVDQPTFDELVERHGPLVFRVCRAVLRDEHLGSDASQETFVKLWRRLADGADPRHVGGWLRRVAVSTSLDLARRRRAREFATTLDPADEVGEVRDASACGPLERTSLAELERGLERAVRELPEGQRTVFLLRHEGGLPLCEIAAALDVALPTVKTQFARACLKLQRRLAPFDPDAEQDPR